jgi:hypothetical protein
MPYILHGFTAMQNKGQFLDFYNFLHSSSSKSHISLALNGK